MADEEKGASRLSLFLYEQFPTFYKSVSRGKVPRAAVASERRKIKTAKPKLPQVNLLPPRLALEEARRATRRGLLLTAASLAALIGLIWFGQSTSIDLASQSLTAAQEQVDTSVNRAQTYKPIGDYFDSLQSRLDLAAARAGGQIDYQRVMERIAKAMPPGAVLTSIETRTVKPADANANPLAVIEQCGPVNDPFQTVPPEQVIGCVTFSGTVSSRDQIGDIISGLAGDPLLANVYAAQASQGAPDTGSLSFSGTAAVTSAGRANPSAGDK